MTARADRLEAIVFDTVLIVFTTVIVGTALGLNAGARLVPLVIGVPTLVGLLVQLRRDLHGVGAPADVRPPMHAPLHGLDPGQAGLDALLAAAAEEEAAEELPSTPDARRKQAVFAAWAFAFAIVAFLLMQFDLPGYLIATPIALLAILVYTTQRLVMSALVTITASILLYLVFRVLLDVPF